MYLGEQFEAVGADPAASKRRNSLEPVERDSQVARVSLGQERHEARDRVRPVVVAAARLGDAVSTP